jgi:hypothetical protein
VLYPLSYGRKLAALTGLEPATSPFEWGRSLFSVGTVRTSRRLPSEL